MMSSGTCPIVSISTIFLCNGRCCPFSFPTRRHCRDSEPCCVSWRIWPVPPFWDGSVGGCWTIPSCTGAGAGESGLNCLNRTLFEIRSFHHFYRHDFAQSSTRNDG